MSSISSFDIICIPARIPASAADATSFNPNRIKTLLANGLITFFINGNPVFSNGPKNLPRNPHNCTILANRDFDNLISVDELFELFAKICNLSIS